VAEVTGRTNPGVGERIGDNAPTEINSRDSQIFAVHLGQSGKIFFAKPKNVSVTRLAG
jgi:hypothetical protein